MPKKNSIPDRWLQYQAIGNKVGESRFVAMKVPLKKQISVPRDETFSCDDVFQHFNELNQDLGLIIDLTFTSRYYNPESFTDHGVDHCKILMPGHELPSDRIVETFRRKVQSFEEENVANNKLIAVHCTHGVNRTGYLICRYLIEEKGMDANHAITAFEHARGHGIERPVYLNSLRKLKETKQGSPKSDKPYYQSPSKKTKHTPPQRVYQHPRQPHRSNRDWSSNRNPSGHDRNFYYSQRAHHSSGYGPRFSGNWRSDPEGNKRYSGMHKPQYANESYGYYGQDCSQRQDYFNQQHPRHRSDPYRWSHGQHFTGDGYY